MKRVRCVNVKLVVIGLGWAGRFHAEAVLAHPNAELVAVVDQNVETAKRYADVHGNGNLPIFPSVSDLLASDVQIDGGLVCTLPATHISISRTLLEHGKHVNCEKPLGREPQPLEDLLDLSAKQGLKVGVNCNQRFAPTVQKLRSMIESQEKVHMIRAMMHQKRPPGRIYDYHIITDACIHMIDSLRFLNGEIAAVHAFGQRIDSDVLSDVTVNLQFVNGSIGTMSHTYMGSLLQPGQHPFQRMELSTDCARYTIDNLMDELVVYPHEEAYRTAWHPSVFAPKDYSVTMKASVSGWIDSICQDTPPPVGLMDALHNIRVAQACIESLETGHTVCLEGN